MEYCDVCDCDVPYAGWIEHVYGRRHLSNDDSMIMYCDLCDCGVPATNWLDHIYGRRHEANEYDDDCGDEEESDDDDNCDDCGESDEVSHHVRLHDGGSIMYKQNSIAPYFSGGWPSLSAGIANVRHLSDETNVDAFTHVVDVEITRDGQYVAMNSRTLYCYMEAGCSQVPVRVVGYSYDGPRYSSVTVRGGGK